MEGVEGHVGEAVRGSAIFELLFLNNYSTSIRKPPGLPRDVYAGIPFSSLEGLCSV